MFQDRAATSCVQREVYSDFMDTNVPFWQIVVF